MKFNVTKTIVVHFRRLSQDRTVFNYKIGQETINVVDKYKYLGCILTESLDYTSTESTLDESAGRALG